MVGYSRYFLFQFFHAGKGRGSEKKSSAVGKGTARVLLGSSERDRRRRERPLPERIEFFGAARESGFRGRSRPAQPVEQVDGREPKGERRGRVCNGCTGAGTDRCHRRVPVPAYPLLPLMPTLFLR